MRKGLLPLSLVSLLLLSSSAGAGMFDSGIPDLATNKRYMEGFGSKRLKQGSGK